MKFFTKETSALTSTIVCSASFYIMTFWFLPIFMLDKPAGWIERVVTMHVGLACIVFFVNWVLYIIEIITERRKNDSK